ncbi:MAG: hypothetical protein P1P74_07830 [Desulfuromonadales bacterium]|nr:hypothetical protein [Desulfuromonadales bacterium]MDT8423116.1 hypothetical protein [Desulfuromonadales bacterium]
MASVKRFLIFAAFVGSIWFVHSINPTFDDHMDRIQPEGMTQQINWDDLIYTDLYFLSFTKSYQKQSMVSFGLCRYVNVVDDEWAQRNVLPEEDPFR